MMFDIIYRSVGRLDGWTGGWMGGRAGGQGRMYGQMDGRADRGRSGGRLVGRACGPSVGPSDQPELIMTGLPTRNCHLSECAHVFLHSIVEVSPIWAQLSCFRRIPSC